MSQSIEISNSYLTDEKFFLMSCPSQFSWLADLVYLGSSSEKIPQLFLFFYYFF